MMIHQWRSTRGKSENLFQSQSTQRSYILIKKKLNYKNWTIKKVYACLFATHIFTLLKRAHPVLARPLSEARYTVIHMYTTSRCTLPIFFLFLLCCDRRTCGDSAHRRELLRALMNWPFLAQRNQKHINHSQYFQQKDRMFFVVVVLVLYQFIAHYRNIFLAQRKVFRHIYIKLCSLYYRFIINWKSCYSTH